MSRCVLEIILEPWQRGTTIVQLYAALESSASSKTFSTRCYESYGNAVHAAFKAHAGRRSLTKEHSKIGTAMFAEQKIKAITLQEPPQLP